MKTNKETLKAAMDRRLSFLDERPSCRPALMQRIAQEEAPVMKKKVSIGFVFALVLVSLSVIGLAAGLLLSPKVTAARLADQALEKTYGITTELQTFFGRSEEELPDGSVRVTYYGAGELEYVLGSYTVTVKDGRADATWSRDGENTAGGYEADAWGIDQLKQMFEDSKNEDSKMAYVAKALAIAESHGAFDSDDTSSEPVEPDGDLYEQIEATKTAALNARRLSEEEMVDIGREFIISNYELNDEQIGRMELYTELGEEAGNGWYDMVDGKPCFMIEYLLYQPLPRDEADEEGFDFDPRVHQEKDGYYKVYVNVETGVVEQYEYNSGLGGLG